MIFIWIGFIVCVTAIGIAGSQLSRYGDVIGQTLGLSGTWVGLVLLATVTSLPELITGVSSVTIADTPNIALGDVLGSCIFNLLILAFLDVLHRGESVYSNASTGHILSASLGVLLIGFTGLSLLLAQQGIYYSFYHIGFYTPIIIVLYAISMQIVYRYEKRQMRSFIEEQAGRVGDIDLKGAIKRYLVAASVVVAAGTLLPFIGKEIATNMGWNTTFVGTLFIAFATSVPEIVVTISALRIGAVDMAISNVLGSNLFDILIVAIDDIFYTPKPLLAAVSSAHAVTAMLAVIMSAIVIVGLLYKPKTKFFRYFGWISAFLFLIYLFNAYIIFLHGE